MRQLVTPYGTIRYKVGRGSTRIVMPERQVIVAENHDIVGVTADAYERGQWKHTQDGMVTPKRLRDWIDRFVRIRALRSTAKFNG